MKSRGGRCANDIFAANIKIMQTRFFMVILMSLLSATVFSQDRGIGLRAGDPFGLTYKKYSGNDRAIELGLGTSSRNWHYTYYRNSFNDYSKYDNYRYISHYAESIIYFQGRYLLQYDFMVQGMEGKWQWYWGVGGVMKLAKVEYRFQRNLPFNEISTDVTTDVDLGPEGIIGTEYTFEDIPLTFFGEVSLMIEVVDRPAALQLFGALGARLNF